MMTNKLTVLLALSLGAAAGCAADAPTVGPGTGSGNGPGSGSGSNDAPTPATIEGKYAITSDYDLAANAPGQVGAIANAFIDMTDSPDDPAKWIVDHAIDQIPNGTFKSLAQGVAPLVTGYLNDQLLSVAPDFVSKIKDIGNKFGDIAKHFGTIDTLDVAKSGAAYTTTHTVTGAHFVIDTVAMDFLFTDYSLTNVTVPGVASSYDPTGKLSVGDHKVPLAYGKILRIALDQAIIPMVDPGAPDLAGALGDLVDCSQVGQAIADQVGFGSASMYGSACTAGLAAGANLIYQQIANLDSSALEFGINGTCKATDTNHDGKLDTLTRGAWNGTATYAGTPAPLATATFFGARM
jgi:hypothetical protein